MAAAVADRHNIAVRLLSAAGSAVGALVRHANRYGQTAVHIAARKGSLPLLTALLTIGGPSVAAVGSRSLSPCHHVSVHLAAGASSQRQHRVV